MFYFGLMNPKLKAKIFRFSFLLNAFIFFIGGLGLVEDGKTGLAMLQFVTAVFNVSEDFVVALESNLNITFKIK